ncbi:MAG: hypothetical protein KJ833_09545 [Alphaproteobacteria bacterium]|nr:hypothetical protein [Alphaproteobacteria bacterium]
MAALMALAVSRYNEGATELSDSGAAVVTGSAFAALWVQLEAAAESERTASAKIKNRME